LVQTGKKANIEEAGRIMKLVPTYRQRIAGKSIPVEKYVARKARKYEEQGDRLLLPAFEFICVLQVMPRLTPVLLCDNILPQIRAEREKLSAYENTPKQWGNGKNYWDDYCLARYMEGVVLRYIAYPDPDAVIDPSEKASIPIDEASAASLEALEDVISNGPKIELDHYIVYHTHYELGRLQACRGNIAEGKRHLELVMSGKTLEINSTGKKGKYSLENALMVRTHAAIEALENGRAV